MAIKNTNYGGTDWVAGAVLSAADLNDTIDAGFDQNLQKAGGTMTGALIMAAGITIQTGQDITLTDAPSASTDATNKTYVDTTIATAVANVEVIADLETTDSETNKTVTGGGWVDICSDTTVVGAGSQVMITFSCGLELIDDGCDTQVRIVRAGPTQIGSIQYANFRTTTETGSMFCSIIVFNSSEGTQTYTAQMKATTGSFNVSGYNFNVIRFDNSI